MLESRNHNIELRSRDYGIMIAFYLRHESCQTYSHIY